jgi:iron complex outermembrane receptor protein
MNLFKTRVLCAAVATACTPFAYGQDAHTNAVVDEIIVTSSLQQTRAETALPVNVLSGEALREKAASTLGETLKELVGVNSASFGSGVGLPIIRGQTGNRVQVLQGGVSNMDASAISPDHANSVEAILAERIEVIRGPATLLYGNGAIGGVVNVIDNRIPTSVPEAFSGLMETRNDSVSDQQTTVLKLEAGAGNFAFHLDGTYRESNNTTIPGFAVNPRTVDIGDEEALEQLLDSKGQIDNSQTRAHANTGGFSWNFDGGYIGASVAHSRSNYGLPAAAHAHHEGEDHADEDHAEDELVHEEESGIRIAMQQNRYDFEGLRELDGFFTRVQGKISTVDYQHAEIEADGAIGTVYSNEGSEGRFTLTQSPIGNLEGVTGLQVGSKTFSAVGEEAYIAATDIKSLGLFTVQSLDVGDFIYEFGLRAEQQRMDQAGSACDDSTNSLSGSASALWRVRDDTNLMLALAHSQRAASVEERFSNIANGSCTEPADPELLIAHAATQRFEIGDPLADKEQSTNIEIGLRRHMGTVTGDLNLFYNNIKDYLYMRDTGVYVDDVQIARMTHDDAVFTGVEAEFSLPISEGQRHFTELSVFGDYVRARLDANGNAPRIPPMRYGAEVVHTHSDWQYKLRVTQVAKQEGTALNERPTNGYTMVNASVDYHANLLGNELTLFGKANNLLDEEVRNHASLLKDVAPEAGRNVVLGLRFEF